MDPALIRHFFGDKDTLFATAVADRSTIPHRLAQAVGNDWSTAGRAVTDTYLRLWEEPDTRRILLALVRSATTSDRAAQMLREILGARAREQVGADQARMRNVAVAAAHLFGVAVARHVIRVEALVEPTHDQLVAHIAPTIQRYLTGDA